MGLKENLYLWPESEKVCFLFFCLFVCFRLGLVCCFLVGFCSLVFFVCVGGSFLGLHLQHIEVPRLGVESKL